VIYALAPFEGRRLVRRRVERKALALEALKRIHQQEVPAMVVIAAASSQ